MKQLRLLTAIIVFAFGHGGRALGSRVEDIPLDSWVYDAVFELSTLGHFDLLLLHTRPYTRGEVADAVAHLSDDPAALPDGARFVVMRLQSEFAGELTETPDGHLHQARLGIGPTARTDQFEGGYSKNRIGFDATGSLTFGQTVTARTRLRLDSDGRPDTQFHGKYWKKNFSGWVDQAVVTAHAGRFRAAFGREFWRWGPSPVDAMLISDHSSPFDGLRLRYRARNWSFAFHAAMLDSMRVTPSDYPNPDSAGPVGTAKRYLVAHRFNWRPHRNLELALSEVMVFGGIDRPWALNYLNPLLPYYWEQLNNDSDDNPLWNLEVSWRPTPGLEVYGEWMIDDFQIDFTSEPQQIGFLAGFAGTPRQLQGRLFVNGEYQRINTFVYGQNRPWNRYFHHRDLNGQVIGIGSNLGTDADRLTLRPRYHISSRLDIGALAEYIRRGADRMSIPQRSGVPKNVKFPSGTVERDLTLALGIHAQWGGHVIADFSGGYNRVDNAGNRAGVECRGPFVRLRFTSLWWKTFGV